MTLDQQEALHDLKKAIQTLEETINNCKQLFPKVIDFDGWIEDNKDTLFTLEISCSDDD